MKDKLLVDCHIGTQDLPALQLSHRLKNLEICALTACYDPETAVSGVNIEDLRALCAQSSFDVDCALGARQPIIPRRPCNGGNTTTIEDYLHPPKGGYAWDLMYKKAVESQNGLVILLLGPATNLAIALLRYPMLRQHIRQIIIAGGSFGFGDVAPYSERGVFEDAYACKILLNSGIPISMIGFSAVADAALSLKELEKMLITLVGKSTPQCLTDLLSRCFDGQYIIPSIATIAWMLDPSVVQMDHFHVDVELNGTEMYGRTVIEWRHYLHKPEETEVAVTVNKAKLLSLINNEPAED